MITCSLILVLIVVCSSEPHCSKFHYEEKLLEKMIRTELLVENIKKQMDDMEARVTGALTNLNEERITWKGEMETVQEESKENLAKLQEEAKSDLDKNIQKVQDLKDDMEAWVTGTLANLNKDRTTWKGEMETQQEESKENLAKLQKEAKRDFDKSIKSVQNLKDKLISPSIAFTAKNVKDTSPGSGDTIIFPDILLNLGEAYNSDTGVFTAPYGGIYLFTIQLCMDNGLRIEYGLVVDGVYMDIARYGDNYGGVSCHKLTKTLLLQTGNKAWIKVITRRSSGQILYHNDAHYWTSLSGALIHTN